MERPIPSQQETLPQTQSFWQQYLGQLTHGLNQLEASLQEEKQAWAQVLDTVRRWLLEAQAHHKTVYLVGNGGSAGMASHMAVDFWKNGGIRATTFNDSAQLTCLANDLGYEASLAAAVAQFGNPGDLLVAISCSGRSENILQAARQAHQLSMKVITCSGFAPDNPLRRLGDASFYVPSFSYGITETLHQFILHAMLDVKMYHDDQKDIFHGNAAMR